MSILFDGSGDYAQNTNPPPVLTPVFSVMAWEKLDDVSANSRAIWAMGQSGSADHYHRLYLSGSKALLATTRDTTTSNSTSGSTVSDTTTWHLVGGVWAATNSRTSWLDSVASTTNTGNRTGVTSPAVTEVGRLTDGTHSMSGRIGHWAMWNIALTQTDWDALYAGANPLAVQAANLVWYVPALVDANDVVGSYHLSLVNQAQIDGDNPTVDSPPSGAVAPSLFVVSSGIRWN